MNDPDKLYGAAENDFFYSVLNLNRATSRTEINERHRSLSLIFHPDKQQDENAKVVATQKFLEIQKAYQVLSDPFLREVYDILGEEGLALKWTPDFRSKDPQEVREALRQLKDNIRYKKLDERILPRGALTCGVDFSPLFSPSSYDGDWPSRILRRLEDVRIMNAELRHTVQKTTNDKTNISLESRVHRQAKLSALTFLGTVRHQFSPRFSSEAVFSFLQPHVVHLSGTYRENGNAASVRTSFAPAILHRLPPSLTLSLSRKLFRRRLEVASLELHVGQQPHLKLELMSPTIFGLGSIDSPQMQVDPSNPPSTSGMKLGTTHRTFGLQFESIVPKLFGEWGITFAELALRFKVGFEYGFAGFNWVFTGSWSNQTTELSVVTHFSGMGIVTELDIAHMEQRLSLPIVLALEPNPSLFFCVVAVPSTALVLGYHFIIKPRRRMQRLAHIRASRQALEEESGMRRQRDAITGLLKDTARRSQQAETSKGGLVILEATYGSAENGDGAKDLVIDVTVPLQALVRSSQLYIPSSQTKLGIQGFSDPAPFVDKELHIRYSFRGQMHYAEIPDLSPVVLPLAEHFPTIGDILSGFGQGQLTFSSITHHGVSPSESYSDSRITSFYPLSRPLRQLAGPAVPIQNHGISHFVSTMGYQLQELTCTTILESSQRPSQAYLTPIANSVDYSLNLDIKVRVVKSFNPVNLFSGGIDVGAAVSPVLLNARHPRSSNEAESNTDLL